ncbi:MAG: anti-sigma factor family protein [Candidatus Dormibacteria bacterium]
MIGHISDEVLSAHLDGDLDPREDRQARDHLASCLDCSRRLELLGATARVISALPGESLPAPLDLAFLSTLAADPLVIPQPRRWRPPTWAAPVLAAAAVLLVAVTLGPRLLPHGGASTAASTTGSATSRSLTDRSVAGSPSGAAGAGATGGTGGTAASGPGVPALGQFAAAPGAHSARSFAQAGNAMVDLNASQPTARGGDSVTLMVAVRAGSTDLQVQRAYITVSRGNVSQQVAAGGTELVPAGQARSVSGTWVAGKLGSAAEAPGDYLVEGHVVQADGSELRVSLTITVS